jgi:hypothetical protein
MFVSSKIVNFVLYSITLCIIVTFLEMLKHKEGFVIIKLFKI